MVQVQFKLCSYKERNVKCNKTKKMNQYKINNLDEVLNKKVLSYTTKPLTLPGENYGSLMLDVQVKIKNDKNNKEEEMYLVAKMFPESEFLQMFFNSFSTFKKEIGLYKDVIPALQEFVKSQGMKSELDIFPSCHGARLNNSLSNEVDHEAILILENLKKKNYVCYDSLVGFDLETAQLVVKSLAVFHAVPIALKLKQPELFNAKIMPHLQIINVFENMSEEGRTGMLKNILEIVKEIKGIDEALYKRVEAGLFAEEVKEIREPFATFVHNDFWTNNTMIRKSENGKPLHNVIVDFQTIIYGSPVNDLIFFLFSSIQLDVIKAHYEDFIKLYHSKFIETLQELHCGEVEQQFTFELLKNEIDLHARSSQFRHVMVMLRPLYTDKSKMVDKMASFAEKDFMENSILSEEYPKRLKETILLFAQHNWI